MLLLACQLMSARTFLSVDFPAAAQRSRAENALHAAHSVARRGPPHHVPCSFSPSLAGSRHCVYCMQILVFVVFAANDPQRTPLAAHLPVRKFLLVACLMKHLAITANLGPKNESRPDHQQKDAAQ